MGDSMAAFYRPPCTLSNQICRGGHQVFQGARLMWPWRVWTGPAWWDGDSRRRRWRQLLRHRWVCFDFVNTASIHGLSMILLTLRRPLFSYGYSCKTSWLRRNFWYPGTLTLRRERQRARMPKITNDRLTRLFYSCTLMQQWSLKRLIFWWPNWGTYFQSY